MARGKHGKHEPKKQQWGSTHTGDTVGVTVGVTVGTAANAWVAGATHKEGTNWPVEASHPVVGGGASVGGSMAVVRKSKLRTKTTHKNTRGWAGA